MPSPSGTVLTAMFHNPLYVDIKDGQADISGNTYTAIDCATWLQHQLKPLRGMIVPRSYWSCRGRGALNRASFELTLPLRQCCMNACL